MLCRNINWQGKKTSISTFHWLPQNSTAYNNTTDSTWKYKEAWLKPRGTNIQQYVPRPDSVSQPIWSFKSLKLHWLLNLQHKQLKVAVHHPTQKQALQYILKMKNACRTILAIDWLICTFECLMKNHFIIIFKEVFLCITSVCCCTHLLLIVWFPLLEAGDKISSSCHLYKLTYFTALTLQ